jgi:hypothetical protein
MTFVNKLNSSYKKEMDVLNFFFLIHNYKLIENIIYDQISKRAKDYVLHINLINSIKEDVTSLKQDPIQFENDANTFYKDIIHIKNTDKILNINQLLYQEFVRLKVI